MPTYGMGEAIREMRQRLGYTQEELSYGICTPGTLSRIENGRAVVSKRVFELLYSRMPGLHHVWISCNTKEEMQRSKLCKQILIFMELRKMSDAKKAIEQYGQIKNRKSPFCLQFEMYTQAIYQAILGEQEEQILSKLKHALEFTMPCCDKRFQARKGMILLSYDEIYILSNMGIAYAKRMETEKAFRILYYLKEYMEKQNLDLSESAKIGPMIFGNLAWLLMQQGQYGEAVKQCDSGIEICLFSGKYAVLPNLLCIKAKSITASGNRGMAEKSMRQAQAILDISEHYRGYGSFEEFYEAMEPIFVTY